MTLLFESWYPSLVRYVWRATGSFESGEDIVQETFLALYRELRRGTEIENAKAWSLCVVRRKIGRHARSRTFEAIDDLDALPAPPPGVQLDDLTRLMGVLTPREEEVLLLRLSSLKYHEIAEQLGISPNSVNTMLARALRKLQKAAAAKPGDRTGEIETRPSGKNAQPKTLQ